MAIGSRSHRPNDFLSQPDLAAIRVPVLQNRPKTFSCPLTVVGAILLATTSWSDSRADEPKPVQPVVTASKAASTEDIQKWITQLSDDAFPVRQAASARLLGAGTPARDALVVIAEGPDPETRAAAQRLVALIDRTEFNRRLEAFAADTDGKRGLMLPGWEKFRKLVGHDPAARALFVEMQRAEGPLLAAAFGMAAQPLERLWEERTTRLVTWQMMRGNRAVAPRLGSCAAMVFLGSVREINVSDHGADLIENLVQRPPINEALAGGAPQDAVRRLVVAWILHCPNHSERNLASRLQLSSANNLKGGLPLALAVATGEKDYAELSATTRAAAALVVGQFGAAEHADKLEPLLTDSRVCLPIPMAQPNQLVPNVQVRDVAICVMIQLTGQKPADYGYLHARLPPQHVFDIRTLHVANDQVRSNAADKWKAWRKSEEALEVMKRHAAKVEDDNPDASTKKRSN
jgi:hypothetical protein